jgi:hypothetical protein
MSLADWDLQRDKTGATVLFSKESQSTGIRIGINKGKRTLEVSGWYDSMVGIEGAVISMEELEQLMKPTRKKKMYKPKYANQVTAQLAVLHGLDCIKTPHCDPEGGYLHGERDDSAYDVDGVSYCGRCHGAL